MDFFRRPAAAEDDAVLIRGSCSAAQEASDATEIVDGSAGEIPGAAGESLANQQLRDPDIGPADKPDIEQLLSESEATKMLHGQWSLLVLKDGVLNSRDGKVDSLQLLVPANLRHDYLRRVHTGMCGGHLGVRRTMDQI